VRLPSLADRVLAALPSFETAPLARDVAARLNTDEPHVRQAFDRLETEGRAKIVRRGRGLYLVPADYPGRICPVCRAEFELPKESKRVTCGRSCAVKLSWRNPEAARKRRESITAERQTPEARRRIADLNEKRWSRPGERERLSKQAKERWDDPYQAAAMSVAIQKSAQTPERRAAQSAEIKARWDDAEGRDKLLTGIRKTKGSPEWREQFGDILRARWADPVQRERLLKATEPNRQKAMEAVRRKHAKP